MNALWKYYKRFACICSINVGRRTAWWALLCCIQVLPLWQPIREFLGFRQVTEPLQFLSSDSHLVQKHFVPLPVLAFCSVRSVVLEQQFKWLRHYKLLGDGMPPSVCCPPLHPLPERLRISFPSGIVVWYLPARVSLPSRSHYVHMFLWPTPIPSLKHIKVICEVQTMPLKLWSLHGKTMCLHCVKKITLQSAKA